MPQRIRFTIQEILDDDDDDFNMASTTVRQPVKTKSLTLLELCQTINDLRHTSSRNTAQILTRRLYLHPLTISNNAKEHSSKIISNNLRESDVFTQKLPEKKTSPYSPIKRQTYHGLSILSTSFPLTARSNTKLNTSISADNDHSTDFEASTTTISTNPTSLPPIQRNPTSLSSTSKRSASSTRSSFISVQKNPKPNPPNERIDVWRHLAQALQRPLPKDPPTTPLDIVSDFHLQNVPETNYNTIQQIQIYQRKPTFDSIIDEDDSNNED